MTACRHCTQQIEQLPSGYWVDGDGFGCCVKGGLWNNPLTGEVERRLAVEHLPLSELAERWSW